MAESTTRGLLALFAFGGQRSSFLEGHQDEAVDTSKLFFVASIEAGVDALAKSCLVVVQPFGKEKLHCRYVQAFREFENHLECRLMNASFDVADVLLTSTDFL